MSEKKERKIEIGGQKKRKKKIYKGKEKMAQNITTSGVINEHCSCCHGNYSHSNVANGIGDRA